MNVPANLLHMSALEYIQSIQDGAISVLEFLEATLERIRNVDPVLHAYISVDQDASISKAKDIDRRLRSGDPVGCCFGMPISLKDNICVKGGTVTCGSKMLEHFVSPYDATVVSRLYAEDAILVGKTNMDEFAMGLTTEFSAYGSSKNPWDIHRVPGGSSGGAAVATAAFECVASLGSDTGGSVRNPASFCSVVGYKPTYGLISRYGLVSYSNSIEQIGPLSRTVSDTAFLLNVISGKDHNDDTTIAKKEDYLDGINDGLEGMRVGIIQEMLHGEGTDPEVADAVRHAASDLEQLGAFCDVVSLDMVKYSVAAYYTITATEAGSNLARYDNLRYGYENGPSVAGYEFNAYMEDARRMFGPEVSRRMIIGGFVPSSGHTGKYLLKALKVKSKLTREVADAFTVYDLLIAPTVPVPPFCLGEKADDPVALFMVDLDTVTANLTGRPSVSVPYTISKDGLPIGVQLMADTMQDKLLLRAARALEKKRPNLPVVPI